jgi:hypothetical protein
MTTQSIIQLRYIVSRSANTCLRLLIGRGSPADIPYSWALVASSIVLALASGLFARSTTVTPTGQVSDMLILVHSAAEIAFLTGYFHLVLQVRHQKGRFIQMLTALLLISSLSDLASGLVQFSFSAPLEARLIIVILILQLIGFTTTIRRTLETSITHSIVVLFGYVATLALGYGYIDAALTNGFR